MNFRKATWEDAQAVYALYRAAVGQDFCVWNGEYPGMLEVRQDLDAESLYVLTEGGEILGALSIVPENELDGFSCWRCRDGSQREIARVVVGKAWQGRGLSRRMVEEIAGILRQSGCSAIHLSAAKQNLPACKAYRKAGFGTRGEAELYGNSYFLMEKELSFGGR